jgi:hypothetical protein
MGSWRSFSRRVVVCAVAGGALAVMVLAAALPSAASALHSRFSINDGAQYSRSLWVGLGDGGWSSFFEPGVVVWDGGSIIVGGGAAPGFKFPTQTLALVPRACRSRVSATHDARIADMIAEGPSQVDRRYRPAADANLCVVLAGGGDFCKGADPVAIYEGLRTYCAARRVAGFTVVVLTVLPRSDPPTFEASRAVYNRLVRDTWPEFADGLADIAADPRIGDALDNLDRQYYGPGATHPNSAGCAVMAAVTAPVINGLTWRSAACEMRVRDGGSAWGLWRPYVALSAWQLPQGDGTRRVQAEYRDGHGSSVVVSDSIRVDTVPPTTVARGNVVVRRGARATLIYAVIDPPPCGSTATVTVEIARSSGAVVKRFVQLRQPIGKPLAVTFTCRLARGKYRYTVKARDAAGNPQSAAGSARLTVR